jgi:hypothetical protein
MSDMGIIISKKNVVAEAALAQRKWKRKIVMGCREDRQVRGAVWKNCGTVEEKWKDEIVLTWSGSECECRLLCRDNDERNLSYKLASTPNETIGDDDQVDLPLRQ